MIGLKRILAPEDNTPFDEICSFETESCVGIWYEGCNGFLKNNDYLGFLLLPRDCSEFGITFLGHPENLEELDNTVYDEIGEHIDSVSISRHLKINIEEDFN